LSWLGKSQAEAEPPPSRTLAKPKPSLKYRLDNGLKPEPRHHLLSTHCVQNNILVLTGCNSKFEILAEILDFNFKFEVSHQSIISIFWKMWIFI